MYFPYLLLSFQGTIRCATGIEASRGRSKRASPSGLKNAGSTQLAIDRVTKVQDAGYLTDDVTRSRPLFVLYETEAIR